MSYFGIQGYEPRWIRGREAIARLYGRQLAALVGCRLDQTWLLWDQDRDEWFNDGPVLLDFDGRQLEVNHRKLHEISITWDSIDPLRQSAWTWGWHGYWVQMSWRQNPRAELLDCVGRTLSAVELMEWTGGDVADGMVALGMVFGSRCVTVFNALDENGLDFGAPDRRYRRHAV